MRIKYFVQSEYNGCEIQQIMRREFNMSTTWIKRVKLYGTVDLNGVHAKVKEHVKTGDLLFEYEDNSGKLTPPDNVSILYETESYAVVNKPAGMVTHPSYGHLDDSLLTSLSKNTLHPVMRLDRETSGLLIVAKDGYAHNMLVTGADIKKSYLALCYGRFEPESGTMSFPIARRADSVMIRDCVPDGKPSVTHYKTIEYFENAGISLVEFKLETGRCHQIRTHCCHVGHPLLGDGLYGPLSDDNPNEALKELASIYDEKIGRVALHAYKIEYKDPFDLEDKVFEAEIPQDMQRVISSC